MSQLTSSSPLMQPVQYNGQPYFTSQYFHQQYLANSPHGGKYPQHKNFVRVIRRIPAYALHVAQGDVVEVTWSQVDSRAHILSPLFKSMGYNPLTLLNATAQAALSHHLDDEISKQMSVAINTAVAKKVSHRPLADSSPTELSARDLVAWGEIGKFFDAPLHIVQQEAAKAIAATYGINVRPLLQAAPAQSSIFLEDRMLEPTDLARELGWGENKGAAMNRALASLGWQVKTIGGGWEATPAGKDLSIPHAWTGEHSTKSGYNYKWNLAAVRAALSAQGQQGTGLP